MAAPPTSWSQLRQQARTLETQTESLFHTYSQFASASTPSQAPTAEEDKTQNEISDMLEKRSNLMQQLARVLDSEPTQSALKSTNLARHREILQQHRTELRRLQGQIKEARDRANLMSNVRSDIQSYRNQAQRGPGEAEADYMLEERGRLDRSHNVIDGVLSQAYAVNENFGLQRESLMSIQRRITGAAAQIPGVNGLMQRIGGKKRRDGIILGTFIAFCCLMFFWFL
ncbi:putative vesicle transport v-SNARE protein Gos1 [Polychaeton citri CBS 116435]|uniref:Golgi SNAP receptor complex member 1 n=1 Tax=Polychaeton citri CBS 116435 TaxID=1314669 RepID=A0A9P4Q0Y8_9PEZI|nr:putative vesicle transport v-SNARE protein Gos1 [Polychaeton citri CBS 116435]